MNVSQKVGAVDIRRLIQLIVCCSVLYLGAFPANADPPVLEGLVPDKPMILPITVQAAYNNDTMFFNIEWDGDRGDTHDYVRYTNGAWQREGFPRREAQSTIDNDPRRGPTNRTSTNYESRVTFMVNDPNGSNAVPGFAQYGCTMTCHDDSRAMPLWDPSNNRTKYLNDGTEGSLDLWHHRLARSNPIGASDDQHVTVIPEGREATGGRLGDQGNSPWQVNNIVDGKPTYAYDPATTGGAFAIKWDDLHESANRSFRRADAREQGAGPVPVGIDFADAEAQGYVPEEGDTIPRRRLREPTESRGDISALGTTYTPSPEDPLFGHIESNTQRALDTGNPDDTALAEGGVYDIAFAVHNGMVTVRDHYVGFPMSLSVGAGPADIEAVKVDGEGPDALPDFGNVDLIPEIEMSLFLPGIASLEFVNNENVGLEFIDPVTDAMIDQFHAGGAHMLAGGSCTDCHTASNAEIPGFVPGPGGFFGGSMEMLAGLRGGVNTPTPLPIPEPASAVLLALAGIVTGLAGLRSKRRQRHRSR